LSLNPAIVNIKTTELHLTELASYIKAWGRELGFQQIGITDIDLGNHKKWFIEWLEKGFQGEMNYMSRYTSKRISPAELVPGTVRVISARMDYLPPLVADPYQVLQQPDLGYISRYALGRDYHKILRNRLKSLAKRITSAIGTFGHRVFTDSAPVLEKAFAEKSGIGWIGKNSNIISRHAGSWCFLGEIYIDLPLPVDRATTTHCGSCVACLDICPTQAITAPYIIDARKCISYHTIELHGVIPLEFRRAIGNRIYGCDDCQIVCPWNRFANLTLEPDFCAKGNLDAPRLTTLFAWDETEFLHRTEGSAIRRIGHIRWLRNIATALGNSPYSPLTVSALQARLTYESGQVHEHVLWALEEQKLRAERSHSLQKLEGINKITPHDIKPSIP
jgi:epoxyqueuosine reductase